MNELSEKDTFWANMLVVNTNDRIEKVNFKVFLRSTAQLDKTISIVGIG